MTKGVKTMAVYVFLRGKRTSGKGNGKNMGWRTPKLLFVVERGNINLSVRG